MAQGDGGLNEAKLRAVAAHEGALLVAHFAETRRALQALARDRGATLEVALDDIPLSHFGAERIRPLMQKLGMKPDEPMANGIVSRGIEAAQKRLQEKMTADAPAGSAAEWLRFNGWQS